MKVAIIDADIILRYEKFPSLDAMKTSAYHKQKKDIVHFLIKITPSLSSYDIVYIFSEWTTVNLELIREYTTKMSLHGRYFYNKYLPMPAYIESCEPDYTLYDEVLYNWIIKNKVAPKYLRMVHNSICMRLTYQNKVLMTKEQIKEQIEKNKSKHYIVLFDSHLNAPELNDLLAYIDSFNKTIIMALPISLNTIAVNKMGAYKHLRRSVSFKYSMRLLFDMDFVQGIEKLAAIREDLPPGTTILLSNLPKILSVEVAPLIAHDILEKVFAIICLNYKVRFAIDYPRIAYSAQLYDIFFYFLVCGTHFILKPHTLIWIRPKFYESIYYYELKRGGPNKVTEALKQYAKDNADFFYLTHTLLYRGDQEYDIHRRIYKR